MHHLTITQKRQWVGGSRENDRTAMASSEGHILGVNNLGIVPLFILRVRLQRTGASSIKLKPSRLKRFNIWLFDN